MLKTRISVLAVVVLLLTATTRAGDFATLNFIGFSKNGRYLAFEEYGTQDGSGFPYSNYYFIDVEKNAYAAPSIAIRIDSETAEEPQARARAKARAAATLRRLRILDRNTGTMVVSRMLTDAGVNNFLSDDPDKTQTINFAEIIGSMYRAGDYDLILKPVQIEKTKDCDYSDPPIYKFELSLKNKDTDKTVVLQKDGRLPSSRWCPMDYAMQFVYLYEDSIAVFINTYSIGFEGPDMRYLVVTGKFK